jgi:hypothetical protein
MLAYVEKRAKATPAPGEHSVPMSWVAISSNFGAGPVKGRTTFCDDAIAQAKKVPSPSRYTPQDAPKVLLGIMR